MKRLDKAKSIQPINLKVYSENVLQTSIIEEFIRGEEYAIDYYYDNNGDAVLLNVLHHPFLRTDTRVYSTSKAIIEKYKIDLEYF
jgi:hypothetical protein